MVKSRTEWSKYIHIVASAYNTNSKEIAEAMGKTQSSASNLINGRCASKRALKAQKELCEILHVPYMEDYEVIGVTIQTTKGTILVNAKDNPVRRYIDGQH